jgi:hypothetical protein
MKSPLRERVLAVALIAVAWVAWATVLPLGTVEGTTYRWVVEEWDVGVGTPVRVWGEVVYEAQGWGMIDGPFRHGSYRWSAEFKGRGGAESAPMSAELKLAALKDFPGAPRRDGYFVEWAELPFTIGMAALFFFLTTGWWVGVSSWTWIADRTRAQNLLSLGLLVVWPWLVATSNGWALADAWGLRGFMKGQWIHPDHAISLTGLLVSLGLVALFTRRAWGDEEQGEELLAGP